MFKAGLRLAETAQPAIAPLAGMALGLTRSIAQRNRNVSVQDFYLGLDFAGTSMGARLAQGDYIAVQIPEALKVVWDDDGAVLIGVDQIAGMSPLVAADGLTQVGAGDVEITQS